MLTNKVKVCKKKRLFFIDEPRDSLTEHGAVLQAEYHARTTRGAVGDPTERAKRAVRTIGCVG